VFDRAALLNYVDGDRELLHKIVGRFRENGPKLLSQVREAIVRQDGPAVEFSAHKLKGAAGSFFAQSAWDAALRLETLGREGCLDTAPQALETLEQTFDRLQLALAALEQEETPCPS
jgi:HPt (histidine-containing phosphotransfer) domain-containing protein